MSLALQIYGNIRHNFPSIFRREVLERLGPRADWSQLYQYLIAQNHIWAFRDIFLATMRCFGLRQTCRLFFGTTSCRDRLLDDWNLYKQDESISLAQLDILVSIIFEIESKPGSELPEMEWLQAEAQTRVQSIMELDPEAMKTRPFALWILAKAATSNTLSSQELLPNTPPNSFSHLSNFPGFVISSPGQTTLPIYIPLEFETPIWTIRETLPEEILPIKMVLDLATQRLDYQTQAQCLKLLILRSQDPTQWFEQLCTLQNSLQGDRESYLWTLLSSYLICTDAASQKRLLADLEDLEDWTEEWVLRNPELYFAKHWIERVLVAKISGSRELKPLRRSGMKYYPWLSLPARMFIDRLTLPNLVPFPGYLRSRGYAGVDEIDAYDRLPSVVRPTASHPEEQTGERRKVYRGVTIEDEFYPSPPGSSYHSNRSSSSSSSSSSDEDSDHYPRILFPHANKPGKRRNDPIGKDITIIIQHPKGAKEYTGARTVIDGEFVYITTKKKRSVRTRGDVNVETRGELFSCRS